MSCCVENEVGLIFFKDLIDPEIITHRSDKRCKIELAAVFHDKLLLYLIGAVLVNINYDDLFRLILCDLAHKLRTDASAAAGNKAGLSPDEVLYVLVVEFYRLSSEKVLDLDVVYLVYHQLVLVVEDHIADERYYLYGDSCL